MESPLPDARHTGGDVDGCKARTTAESPFPDARHTGGDVDRFKARTAIESTIPDARHTIGDVDGCQAGAKKVFTNWYISTTYALNGRKVTIKILRGTNIM